MKRHKRLSYLGVTVGVMALLLWVTLRRQEPRISAATVIEAGSFNVGEHALVRFQVANIGGAPLRLFALRSSCGCLSLDRGDAVKLTKDDEIIISPNSKLDLRATLAVRGIVGERVRNSLAFATNDPATPELIIHLVTDVACEPVVSVPASICIPQIVTGESIAKRLRVHAGKGHPAFDLLRIHTSNPDIVKSVGFTRAPVAQIATTAAGGSSSSYDIDLLIQAPSTSGIANASIHVCVSGDRLLTIPITINVINRLQMSPAVLFLPRYSGEQAIYSATCLCKSAGSAPLSISPRHVPEGFRLEIDERKQAAGYVLLTIAHNGDKPPVPGRHVVRVLVSQSDFVQEMQIPVVVSPHGS